MAPRKQQKTKQTKEQTKEAVEIKEKETKEIKENIISQPPVIESTDPIVPDKQEKQEKQEKQDKKKRRFSIFYNDKVIEGAYVTGSRPKQAALKALSVIFNNFYKNKETKKLDKDIIGKEIKFYITENIGVGKSKITKHFFYKGMKKYIVTEDTKDEYKKKTKDIEFETDSDGIIGIVARHKNKNGEVKKIVHKYINVVLMDREAGKEFREKEKEEKKKVKQEQKEQDKIEKSKIVKTPKKPRAKKNDNKAEQKAEKPKRPRKPKAIKQQQEEEKKD